MVMQLLIKILHGENFTVIPAGIFEKYGKHLYYDYFIFQWVFFHA